MNQSFNDFSDDFRSDLSKDFSGQLFNKIHRLLFNGSPYRSLIGYFMERPGSAESEPAESEPVKPNSNSDPSNSPKSSDRGASHKPYLPNTLSTPAEEEAFFMSSVLNSNNSSNAIPVSNDPNAASVPMPIAYFIQNASQADANQEPKDANQEKVALNDRPEPVQPTEEISQLRAELKQLAEAQANFVKTQANQAAEINALRVRNNELHVRVEAQDKMLAEYRGGFQVLEAAHREWKVSQSTRMESFEHIYKRDRIQTARQQQAKDQLLEDKLQSTVDLMLAEAVEKAIRLLHLGSNRRVPTPARQPSTPCIDHLYVNRPQQPN